jgi:endonuclease YncB( thermonuclease family)
MPMLCLAGAFRVLGTEPDGDSIRFVPGDPTLWGRVPGGVRVNAQGGAQMRLDGIDALETHYTPHGGQTLHQPLGLAHAASAELLDWLGFRDVERKGETITSVAADDLPGFLLTRTADKYGRCVALIGRGDAPAESGSRLKVMPDLLRETVNHHQISAGLAYPTFYTKLYADLRNELAAQTEAARAAGTGVFADDGTEQGVEVQSLRTLTDDAVLLPKLFRRLADYLHLNGEDPSLAGFPAFLEQSADTLLVVSSAEKTTLADLVDVSAQTVRLTRPPEDLVFDEK